MNNNKSNKNNKNKRIVKGIIIVVVLAMVVTTFASFFSMLGKNGNKPKDKGVTTEVTENTVKENHSEKLDDKITEDMKKDIQKAKVDVKGNSVIARVNIGSHINEAQKDKILDECINDFKKKYKNKDLNINIEHKNKVISQGNISNIALDKNMPKAEVQVSPGIMEMDRYVRVTLNTKNPEKYSVIVLGKKLGYVKEKRFFHEVIDSTDVNAIKKNIKVIASK